MVAGDFAGKTVYLDTAPLIYFIEKSSQFYDALLPLFKLNAEGAFTFVSSVITLSEVLVKPLRDGNTTVAHEYMDILTTATTLRLLDVTAAIAREAAVLRSAYNLRTPDALHLATAVVNGADVFLTNDVALKKVGGVTVVTLAEL